MGIENSWEAYRIGAVAWVTCASRIIVIMARTSEDNLYFTNASSQAHKIPFPRYTSCFFRYIFSKRIFRITSLHCLLKLQWSTTHLAMQAKPVRVDWSELHDEQVTCLRLLVLHPKALMLQDQIRIKDLSYYLKLPATVPSHVRVFWEICQRWYKTKGRSPMDWCSENRWVTLSQLAPPKAKYVEHILVATHAGDAGVAELFRVLQFRLRDSTWTIVFKSLILVHLMIREGEPDVTLRFLADSPSKLAISNFSDGTFKEYKTVAARGPTERGYSDCCLRVNWLSYEYFMCWSLQPGDYSAGSRYKYSSLLQLHIGESEGIQGYKDWLGQSWGWSSEKADGW